MAQLIPAIGGIFKGITLAKGLSIGGTLLSGASAVAQGRQADATAGYEAAQLDAQAKADQAVSQREALQERRKATLAISRARAVGAASGGGTDINLMAEIEEEGDLNYQTALWEGNESAAFKRDAGAARRIEGKQARKAGLIRGVGTLLAGGSSFMDKYA